jgi:hypothetical protein
MTGMGAPTLDFIEGGRAPLELHDGELVVEGLRFTRDSLGGTWVEPLEGAAVTHNTRPLTGRARLADGDELDTGSSRVRFRLPVDDWGTDMSATDEEKAMAPPSLPIPVESTSQPNALPSLGVEDFDDPQTQQMSPEEVQKLMAEARSKPVVVAPPPDGPEALPPPPMANEATGPGLVLPPPVSDTAKSRLAKAVDPDFGLRGPPPPPPSLAEEPRETPSGSIEISHVSEVIENPSQVSAVETSTKEIPIIAQPMGGDIVIQASLAAELPTGVSEVSEITVPREKASGEVTNPVERREDPSGKTELTPLPPEAIRSDPTTQPSLHAIEVPTLQGAMVRARKFVSALLAAPSVRRVLWIDLAWGIALGVGLAFAAPSEGLAGWLAVAGGALLLVVLTSVAGARVAPKVSGLTLASARDQEPVGVGHEVVAVARLRAMVAGPLVLSGSVSLGLAPFHPAGRAGFLGLAAAALVFDAWLRTAYVACFAAWARACDRTKTLDVKLAPPPLAKAFER